MPTEYVTYTNVDELLTLSVRINAADDRRMRMFSPAQLLVVLELVRQLVADIKQIQEAVDDPRSYQNRER